MPSDCPYSLYRTSTDISPVWASVHANLLSLRPFQRDPPLSRPGAWAHPDMLEVGRMATAAEDRAHFGAWCVTSSPLVLGDDLRDDATTARLWPIIANPDAIAISTRRGRAGHVCRGEAPTHRRAEPTGLTHTRCSRVRAPPPRRGTAGPPGQGVVRHTDTGVELWTKPLGGGRHAALLLNPTDIANVSATLRPTDVGVAAGVAVLVCDVWGMTGGAVPTDRRPAVPPVALDAHDARLFTTRPAEGVGKGGAAGR